MECSTPTFDVNLDPNGFIVDVDSLYAWLARLRDQRHARGVRYALVTVLAIWCWLNWLGRIGSQGISQSVKYRKQPLAEIFHLKEPRAPCANTYRNILGRVIAIEDLAQVVREFFAAQPKAGQSIVIALDGKTLRGTITAGQCEGNTCWRLICLRKAGSSFKSKSMAKRMKLVPPGAC